MKAYLFSFQIMFTSQFQKIDTRDWFCGPGSHIILKLNDKTSFLKKKGIFYVRSSLSNVAL